MFVVIVSFHVKSECVEEFLAFTSEDARASRIDPGVICFDLIQQTDDPTRVILYEVYAARPDGERHLEMAHFKQWQSAIAPTLAEPPHAVTYNLLDT